MNYLHSEFTLGPDDAVEVTLDKQANVRLMDDANFSRYKRGEKHSYFGGLATESPVRLSPPHQGHWNVVIDLGGVAGTVRSAVRVLHPA
jgi:hypothetical protein